MNDGTEQRIRMVFLAQFEERDMAAPSLSRDTVLDSSIGLESIDFAELVVRLEEEFGFDPFAEGMPGDLRTYGDLVDLYDRAPA